MKDSNYTAPISNDGRKISQNVTSLKKLVHDLINLLYYD